MGRIFFSAGESSGDIHGSNLIKELRKSDPSVICEGLGGQHMSAAGMDLRYDLAGNAIMGFSEIIKSLKWISRLFRETAEYIEQTRPDCLVLIDYPGFNMRLAKRAKAAGIPVVYYISPQIWAWKKGRLNTIAELVEKMLVILPFEEKIYKDIGVDCTWVGHPLLDHISSIESTGMYDGRYVIGILPGSREQEIGRLLAPMLDIARGIRDEYPEARFVTPCVDEVREKQVREIAGDFPLETTIGKTYEVLDVARFCMVASGTATLETALFNVPMVVLYKVTALTHWLARRLVHVKHISLVNILEGREIVSEFIQSDVTAKNILPVALELIKDSPERQTMLNDLSEVKKILGGCGASERAAKEILEVITRHTNA